MNDRNKKYEILTVNGTFLREAPSGKAFCMAICDEDGKELLRKWFPHSQVKTLDGNKVTGEYRERVTVGIPQWLAENEGVYEAVRESILDSEYGIAENNEPDNVWGN